MKTEEAKAMVDNLLNRNCYILEHDMETPKAVTWEEKMEWIDRLGWVAAHRVALDKRGDSSVSTVFLGRQQMGCFWETMIRGGPLNAEIDRYETRDKALVGHERMLSRVIAMEDRQV